MKEFFSFFRSSLKSNAFNYLYGLIFIAFFFVSSFLYRLPLGAVFYPVCVYLFFILIIVTIKSIKEYRRHCEIQKCLNCIPELPSQFPFKGPIEKDYQELCMAYGAFIYNLQTETESRFSGMQEYYSVWVHQIKTPISSMKLLLQTKDDDFSRQLLRDLARIEQYVEMVLTFMRLESISTDYVVLEGNLDEMIRNCVRKFSSEFIGRKLSLNYEPLNTSIVTDPKWFSFVLEQIISNALKYTPHGSISIYLDEESNLCIKDTGIGISKEDLPRVFDNGYTGLNGRLNSQSTGIGLYLCNRICKNLNHSLKIESDIDKGTLVKIGIKRNSERIE